MHIYMCIHTSSEAANLAQSFSTIDSHCLSFCRKPMRNPIT